jgi:hypothetical protein
MNTDSLIEKLEDLRNRAPNEAYSALIEAIAIVVEHEMLKESYMDLANGKPSAISYNNNDLG